MGTTAAIKFGKRTRNAVCAASDGLPSLGAWLDRIRAIGDPALDAAIEGIWCGRDGRATIDMPGTRSMLCVGWHNGRVEWSYIS